MTKRNASASCSAPHWLSLPPDRPRLGKEAPTSTIAMPLATSQTRAATRIHCAGMKTIEIVRAPKLKPSNPSAPIFLALLVDSRLIAAAMKRSARREQQTDNGDVDQGDDEREIRPEKTARCENDDAKAPHAECLRDRAPGVVPS